MAKRERKQLNNADKSLAADLGSFFYDPLGFVMYAYPWTTESSIQIVKLPPKYKNRYNSTFGPDQWACEFLDDLGAKIRVNDFDSHTPVEPIRMAVASGHGIGKSAMVAWLTDFILCTRPKSQGTITANTSGQLSTKTWPQVVKWTNLCIARHWFNITSGKGSMLIYHVDYQDQWFVSAQTCRKENSEAFQGQHAPTSTSFYIFDECSAVEDIIIDTAEGGLMDGEPMEFAFGNPTRNTGRFKDFFDNKRWDCRQIDSRDVQITNKEFIAQLIGDHGVDSDFVKIRVRGMFPALSAKQFISVNDVDAAFGRVIRPEQYEFAPKILVCDPAYMGDDMLTIGMRQGLLFEILREMPKNDNDVQVANLLANLEDEHKVDMVVLDAGFGTGIQSAGKTMGRNWQLVWSASKNSPDRGCLNMRAYMWKQSRDWLKRGGSIPEHQQLYRDAIAPEIVPRLDGKLQIESKRDLRARGVKSTDYWDLVCLSLAYPVLDTVGRQIDGSVPDDNKPYDPYDGLDT